MTLKTVLRTCAATAALNFASLGILIPCEAIELDRATGTAGVIIEEINTGSIKQSAGDDDLYFGHIRKPPPGGTFSEFTIVPSTCTGPGVVQETTLGDAQHLSGGSCAQYDFEGGSGDPFSVELTPGACSPGLTLTFPLGSEGLGGNFTMGGNAHNYTIGGRLKVEDTAVPALGLQGCFYTITLNGS
jgi:hypothetical protein